MIEFRITKYNPAFRDANGAYRRDEWTSASDVGQSFNGQLLTTAEYQRVEAAYVTSALALLRAAGSTSLRVTGLEYPVSTPPLPLHEGAVVSLAEAAAIVAGVLRDEFWCKLEGPNSFVHIGHDYTMYVGVPIACPQAEDLASRLGLFVESFLSPYREAAPTPGDTFEPTPTPSTR